MMGGADIKKSVAHYFVMNTADFQKNPLNGFLLLFAFSCCVILNLFSYLKSKPNHLLFYLNFLILIEN